MNQLKILISTHYLTEIKSKGFWLGTILVPIIILAFGIFGGIMMADNADEMNKVMNPTAPEPDDMTGSQVLGMVVGMFLTIFLISYGSSIFTSVKKEKVNRIMEVLATCVTGRTLMIAKIISVGLIGLTQMFIWLVIILGGIFAVIAIASPDIPWETLNDSRVYMALIWSILFFIGGYVFYGSIYAACGAMTDKDNENQTYMTILTFLLLGAFYIQQYAVSHPESPFITICSYIPFTAPSVCVVNAASGAVPIWQTLLELVVLYAFAWLTVAISGKIYTGSILLKGRKFSFSDLILLVKMK